MKEFPLLEQMRADRVRREAEINAPLVRQLDQCAATLSNVRQALAKMEMFISSKVSTSVIASIGHQLSEAIRPLIFEALSKVRHSDDIVPLTIPVDLAALMNPQSIEKCVLDRYLSEAIPNMRVSIDALVSDQTVTVLDIAVPTLRCRHQLVN